MMNPDPLFEKKVLLDVVEQMENPQATLRKQLRFKRVILGIGSMCLVSAFFLALNDLAGSLVISVIAALGGCAAGFGVFLETVQKQWPVTARYIDMQGVRKRLGELDT